MEKAQGELPARLGPGSHWGVVDIAMVESPLYSSLAWEHDSCRNCVVNKRSGKR
jgi:hypothetical protein